MLDDVAMTPQSSPVLPRNPTSAVRPSTSRKRPDPLLHRVLDKTYRIQATPLASNRFQAQRATTTPATYKRNPLLESNLSSSPDIPPPKLHAEIFSSPERQGRVNQPQRTPGVSVLTPARVKSNKAVRTPQAWDSDEEDDFGNETGMPFGASPPKTMQFHVPQSRLLQTPGMSVLRLMYSCS